MGGRHWWRGSDPPSRDRRREPKPKQLLPRKSRLGKRSPMASHRVSCGSFDRVSVTTSRPKEAVMHAVVRSYSGQGASELFEQLEQRNEEIKDLIGGVPGFVSYTALRSSEGGATVTVCQDKTGTDESSRRAAEWVKENISTMANPPVTTEGSTVAYFSS